MKLRKLVLLFIGLFMVLSSCNNDDDSPNTVPPRDKGEVYEEDLAEIEEFLSTHFFNYEDFDFSNPDNPDNDTFEIVFDTIAGANSDKISLMDSPQLQYKIVEDSGIDYKLYYLNVRQGSGNEIHFCDEAKLIYEGSTTTGHVFDSAVNPASFNLITVGSSAGVVPGFQQGVIEFKTSTSFTDNGDGTVTYHGHGIGAVFIPSGLGYFQQPLIGVPSYTPLIFKFDLYERTLLDHDGDNVYSYLEDLNMNGDLFDDDTDGDFGPNFIDNEDDGDGYFTADELGYNTYVVDTNMGETEPVLAENEYEMSRTEENGIITIETFVMLDRTDDGTPDFLDVNTIPE
ncbi:FKBP-type peptidyl-prolyl cis-trans isomerase [Hanstruepera flava]|uniref:FKBP-type peptidyl-prolyl cis-trans isomerase n=1 Tax=Hanstruepera flava TaxID=2930218 RepID=UPI0020285757|nr:hypothetical protein [Hanstruepera flava]